MTYLDNAATTFPKPEPVYLAMDQANRTLAVNAGRGAYSAAQKATALIDETRSKLSRLFGADGYADVVFTPSITHALNQVIHGLKLGPSDTVYISPYEHNAVVRTLHQVQKQTGCTIKIIPLDSECRIDIERMEYMFSVDVPDYLILNAVSNVTGYVLPVGDIFSRAKAAGAKTILDAAQAGGLIDMNMEQMQADIICFAGHKTLYGPFGIGGFLIKKDLKLAVTLTGGTGTDSLNPEMPQSAPGCYEASSPNIIAIAGLNAALTYVDVHTHYETSLKLTTYLLERLDELPHIHVVGTFAPGETLGIVSFVVDGYSSDDVGGILNDEFDIAVRTGYHCAPLIHDYLDDKVSNGTVRVGLGIFNTTEDIDLLIDALDSL